MIKSSILRLWMKLILFNSKWALYHMATDLYDDAKNAYKLEIAYPSTIK